MGETFSYPSVCDGTVCDNVYRLAAVRYCPGELSLGCSWGPDSAQDHYTFKHCCVPVFVC